MFINVSEYIIIMSTNAKTIIDNIESILVTNCSFRKEDLSSDQKAESTPVFQLEINSETFGQQHGYGPYYEELDLLINLQFTDKYPANHRVKQITYTHCIRDNISKSNLNTNGLATTKLVDYVQHNNVIINYDNKSTTLRYLFTVKFRRD